MKFGTAFAFLAAVIFLILKGHPVWAVCVFVMLGCIEYK